MSQAGVFPGGVRDDGQRENAGGEQADVHDGLPAGSQPVQQVGVEIAKQKHHLEEQHAGAPHGGGAAEPRQDHLGDDRLHLKQEEGRQGDCERVKKHFGLVLPKLTDLRLQRGTAGLCQELHSTGA